MNTNWPLMFALLARWWRHGKCASGCVGGDGRVQSTERTDRPGSNPLGLGHRSLPNLRFMESAPLRKEQICSSCCRNRSSGQSVLFNTDCLIVQSVEDFGT